MKKSALVRKIGFTSFLFFTHVLCQAQRVETGRVVSINLAMRDSIVKTEAKYLSERIKPHQERTYFWFQSNRIHSTQGSFEGKLLHGPFSSFYLDGNLKSKGIFKNGMKKGKWISWYKPGTIESTTNWKNGIKQGWYHEYLPSGSMAVQVRYKKNQLNGKYIRYDEDQEQMVLKYRKGRLTVKDENGKNLERRIKMLFKNKSDQNKSGENEAAPEEKEKKAQKNPK